MEDASQCEAKFDCDCSQSLGFSNEQLINGLFRDGQTAVGLFTFYFLNHFTKATWVENKSRDRARFACIELHLLCSEKVIGFFTGFDPK